MAPIGVIIMVNSAKTELELGLYQISAVSSVLEFSTAVALCV